MNTLWSDCIQSTGTLLLSRRLRFADCFRREYTEAFSIGTGGRILEIGCGPGALAEALCRWYPEGKITGLDRDSAFAAFARENIPGPDFVEGDAENLPFKDNTFDVTISNTVQEHIEPGKFFGEQYRVLREGGVCLVLSARPSRINIAAPCIARQTPEEEAFARKTGEIYNRAMEKLGVCRYPMTESQLPLAMEQHGFREVSTGFIAINLTPDNPACSREMALAIINANRQNDLDALEYIGHLSPDLVSPEELAVLRRIKNEKYDRRIALYEQGVPLWDVNLSLTMVIRGVK